MHTPRDDAVPLQLPKLLGQHLLRDAGNRALEVGEAQRLAAKEMKEDDELPATIQPADGVLDSGAMPTRACACAYSQVRPSLSRALLRRLPCQVCNLHADAH